MLDYLIQIDQDFLLLVNGCHNMFLDGVMYLYSEKIVWVPFYLSLVYVIAKNFSWRVALFIIVALALVVFIDAYQKKRPTDDVASYTAIHLHSVELAFLVAA